MSPKDRQQTRATPPGRRALVVATVLSVAASLVAVGALAIVLTRPVGDEHCRSLAWGAVPAQTTLPTGWSLASSRFFVDNATLTLAGPAPSGGTGGATVYISVSCYGSDAKLALASARDAAIATGAKERSVEGLGDEALAMVFESTGSTVYVQRGVLVADVTAPESVDDPTLEALLFAVDTAMSKAISAGPPSSSPEAVVIGPAQTAVPGAASASAGSPSLGATPIPSPVSHVAPDLEARLPASVDGTTLSKDSVTGSTALGNDVTSTTLVASLADLGKSPNDLQIARARDPTGERPVRIYAFRVQGADPGTVAPLLANAMLTDTTSTPVKSQTSIGGVPVTKITYSQGPAEYLFEAADGIVFNVETTDESLAAIVLPTLK